ncbi:hypothetical protein [Paraburkholderia humisilvae]|uniref:Uncharacterized protein n=1 Tax=Paraburkholderia humisilvae TaxID=627669 RepID=A0A6J5CYF3_9BURK|nr:hypothetical protein [Paraburkholderia humisilvae]CAB3745885.1 hypothetical protein LMG29542_00068 [Paraburkholderia humisilvae]
MRVLLFYMPLSIAFLFGACNSYSQSRAPHENAQAANAASVPLPASTTSQSAPPTANVVLTADQIRALMDQRSSTADKFEFLRSIRKSTLERLADTTTALASVTATLTERLDAQSKNESRLYITAPTLPSKDTVNLRLQAAKAALTSARQSASKKGISKASTIIIDAQSAPPTAAEAEVDYWQNAFDNYDNIVQQQKKAAEDREMANSNAIKEIADLTAKRDSLSGQQVALQQLVGDIDDMANQLFIASDATNTFKLNMSTAFAILVGLVIVGFFWIASSNEEIKKTIFSNEAGIQFITLFAIVIAVILFGIIGVLESKELSALLGGLSGYILGRSRGNQA